MAIGVKQLQVLIVGDLYQSDALSQWVDENARVHRVRSVDEALRALREEPFDLVISRAPDFIPMQSVHVARQAAAIMDSVNQGLGIVDQDGKLEWANPRMLSLPQEVQERVCHYCVETSRWAAEEFERGSSDVRGRRFGFSVSGKENKEHYELSATPVMDLEKRVTQVAAVIWNTTSTKKLQDKIDAIDQAGRELLSFDVDQIAKLDVQERLALLEQRIMRCTRDLLHFDNFEIRVLNRKNHCLEVVLASGIPGETQEVELFADPEGNGISGFVAARGRSYICPDTANDRRYLPCVEGAQSSLTVPLIYHDDVVGVANFESTRLAAFNEDDRQFAEIFARYVALALNVLDLLVSERQTTTGRLGNDVMTEITGPLNDILTEVENLREDYIGHDDLRNRLSAISESTVAIRETVGELIELKRGVLGARTARKQLNDAQLTGKRILIADDEDAIRETIRDMLRGYGCDVVAVSDGDEAIKLLAEKPFDLVMSDIKMPGKSGYEVFAAAKEVNPETPVILSTGFGYDPNHSIVRARREGLAAVLFKPFKVDQLLGELRMALKSSDE